MFLLKSIGIAIINVKSTIFEPITLPNERAGLFLIADVMPTNNSGNVVAIPIMIKDVVNSLTLRNLVILDKYFTTMLPDFANTTKKIKKTARCSIV